MHESLQKKIGLVMIGRNEGARLARCLISGRSIPKRVYVDSGSTDGSVELALKEGVVVKQLPIPPEFTAARARNAGLEELLATDTDLEFVQMIDGDCELHPGWIDRGVSTLAADSSLAAVFGRRRERYPEKSIYNALCDDEWNDSIGESPACGGDVLFRVQALREVGIYNPVMIAGEDPELAMRLRKKGWKFRCIDAEMTLHDAAILRFGQWWNRARRSGHAYGELAFLHPDVRNPDWRYSVRSIFFWGGVMPLLILGTMVLEFTLRGRWWAATALLLIVWPLRMVQLMRRQRRRSLSAKVAWASGVLLMVGKLPQFLGLMTYYFNRFLGRTARLIEYKGPENPL